MIATTEIPAAFVDPVTLEVTTGIALFNRDPGRDNPDAPADEPVRFDVMSATDPVQLSSLNAWIILDGGTVEPAVVDGSIVAPWNGSEASISTLGPQTVRVVLDGPTFSSRAEVSVRVTATSGVASMDVTYGFVVEDYEPPALVSVIALDGRTIEVTYSEAVTDTALDILSIIVAPTTAPAVGVEIVDVVRVSSARVLLELDRDLFIGAVYSFAITGVADVSGNVADLDATFVGHRPARPASRVFDLWRMIPEINRTADIVGDLRTFLNIWQELVDQLLARIDQFDRYIDPVRAPEWALLQSLIDLGNPFPVGPDRSDRTRLLADLVGLYKLKGTAIGIVAAIRTLLGIDCSIATNNPPENGWILGSSILGANTVLGSSDPAFPFLFRVVFEESLTDEQRFLALSVIEVMRSSPSILDALVEPDDDPDLFWLLGSSKLGVDTYL